MARRLAGRRVPLTDEEAARQVPYTEAATLALARAESLRTRMLTPKVLAAELAAVPDYPRTSLVPLLLAELDTRQGVALCKALFPAHSGALRIQSDGRCFEWLAAQDRRAVERLLVDWLRDGVEPRWVPSTLAQLLGFPVVGDLKRATAEHHQNPTANTADVLLVLLGLKRGAARDAKRSERRSAQPSARSSGMPGGPALRSRTLRSLEAVAQNLGGAVVVDLSGVKLREFPEILLRCSNLKYLEIEDDYFDTAAQRAIEARLPGVEVTWTYGQYIDGRHGR